MTFTNLTFHEGLNCTVRKGTYWSCLSESEKIGLVKSLNKSKERIIARIILTRTMRYRELTNEDVACEHAPHCQGEIKTLLKDMKEIHKGFSANELVTVVYFAIKEGV